MPSTFDLDRETDENDPPYPSQQAHYHSSPSSSDSDNNSPSPPPLQHAFFAPPFYNRPPTPLPPSPSLTSLLRPSRPTTPDSSDAELPQPVPRASPKVPTYEYYGFVLYLFSSLTFAIYLLWSYLPRPFLHALGITYYPNRWWSLAIPSWLVMLLVWIYVALASYNTGYLTLPLGSVETIVDEAANIATVERMVGTSHGGGGGKGKGRGLERKDSGLSAGEIGNWNAIWDFGTDAVMDIPLGGVCEILYGEGRETDDEEDQLDD